MEAPAHPGPADGPAPAKSLAVRLVVFHSAAPGRGRGVTVGQTSRVRTAGPVGRTRAGQLGRGRRSRRGAGLERQLAAAGRAAGCLDDLPTCGKARSAADRGRLRLCAWTIGWIGRAVCLGASPRPPPAVRLAAGLLSARLPDYPATAERPVAVGPLVHAAGVRQPLIRTEVLRYVQTMTTTLRPYTVAGRTKALRVFFDYLADHHPEVTRLEEIERTRHIEPYLAWARTRPWRGKNR